MSKCVQSLDLRPHEKHEHFDAFISHASEDKEEVVRPLALELKRLDLKIWYDEFSLEIGDSLSRSIDRGLLLSDYGIVIVSKKYFEKSWPKQELEALITKQVNLNKRIILPIWHNISKEEVQQKSPILANTVAAKSSEGVENIAAKLYKDIHDTKMAYNFSSNAKLKNDVSSLIKSIDESESLLRQTEEELALVILTKMYLITEGYSNFYISSWPFIESLSSSEREREKLRTIVSILIDRKFVISKALGTISIAQHGIKKIEKLLEDTHRQDYVSQPTEFLHSIGEVEKSKVLEIQKLRHDVLKLAYDRISNQKIRVVNIFEIGEVLGIEREKLQRIHFYLEDEGLIDPISLGGSFLITDKGKQLIEKGDSNRIF